MPLFPGDRYNEQSMTHLSLSFFGSAKIEVDGKTAVGFDYAKMQALLAYLVMESGKAHQREEIAELLWPGKPEKTARNNLRQALAKLRRAIEDRDADPSFLLISRESIQFNKASDHTLDAASFTAVFKHVGRHPHRQLNNCKSCIKQLEQAAALYSGDFLANLCLKDSNEFEEWLTIKRESFRRKAAQMFHDLAAYGQHRQAYEYALPYARQQVALNPWQEESHQQLMRLLALNGQQDEALAQYEVCRQFLVEEVGIEPAPDTVTLYEQIQAELILPVQRPLPPQLPVPRTPFIGRQPELDSIVQRLINDAACRLLTLAGPGGVGKTRLALAAADRIATHHKVDFHHGIYFMPMIDTASAEQMVNNMASALQYSHAGRRITKGMLIDYLRAKEALLVIDNFEYLMTEVDFLEEILANAPEVKILTTSRERLNLYGEWVFPVTGMQYPKNVDETDVAGYEAVQLFIQSARRAQAQFALSAETLSAVVDICHALRGMPLGIELAAAWAHRLSCQEIACEIEQGLDLLQTSWRNFPQQHRSLRIVFDSSWNMIEADKQAVLCKLSLFQDGFSQDAATEVAGVSLSILITLTDKSFLRCGPNGRYQMHPLLQSYAAEKWVAYSEQEKEQTAEQHSAYYARFMLHQGAELYTKQLQVVLDEIELEESNVWQGWQWAIEHNQLNEGFQYLDGLFRFLDMRGRFEEGVTLFKDAAEKLETAVSHTNPSDLQKQNQLLGMLLNFQAMFRFRLSQYQQAKEILQKSFTLASQFEGSDRVQANGLQVFGHVSYGLGQYGKATQQYEESATLFQHIGDKRGEAKSLNSLGVISRLQGQYDKAQTCLRQSLTLFRELDDLHGAATSLNNLGTLLRIIGNYTEARECYQESFVYRKSINDQNGLALTLNNLGNIAAILEETTTARYLYEESLSICQQLGDRMGTARALNNLGILAYESALYQEAERYHLDSMSIKRGIGDHGGMAHSYYQLGRTALVVDDLPQSWLYFRQSLEMAHTVQSVPLILTGLVGIAPLLGARSSPQFALEALTVALQHTALSRQNREEAQPLYDQLVLAVGDDELTAVKARAKKRELNEIVQSIFDLGN